MKLTDSRNTNITFIFSKRQIDQQTFLHISVINREDEVNTHVNLEINQVKELIEHLNQINK